MKKLILLLSCTMMLSSCASLTKEECQLGNWLVIGHTDGANGRSSSRIAEHQKACARVNISPNYAEWERGRQAGLLEYCTESNAYRLGRRGLTINSVCPKKTALQLLKINEKGKVLYRLERKISEDKDKLEKYQEEIKKLKNGEMLDFKTEKEAREYLLEIVDKVKTLKTNIDKNQKSLDKKIELGF
ncbi:MAG: DUF2799 domain-containing protein [Moraxellaceae bacterium]|nr:DUF2799 domain-containing protein [Moraxellaceae bacterium]